MLITKRKRLYFDIETSCNIVLTWNVGRKINIDYSNILKERAIICICYKWEDDRKVYGLTWDENQCDKSMLEEFIKIANQADELVGHNGDKFDIPKLNTRFLLAGMEPPLPYQSVDTLKHIKRNFAFTSNKLEFVNRMLGLPRKSKHEGFELWSKCYIGDSQALKNMLDYNINDVRILEETYLRLRPWIKPHPNTSLFILDESTHRCPTCGSNDLIEQGKKYYTTVNAYTQFRCGNCGATGRKRVSDIAIKQRRHILSSNPK